MGYLDAKGFTYNGVNSDQYGLLIGWYKNNQQELATGLGVELVHGDMNMVRHERNQYGSKYSDVVKLEFGIFKKTEDKFTYEESRKLNNWLRSSDVYKELYFHDNTPEPIHFYAVCTDITDVIINGINMKSLKFECNAPYGFLAKKKIPINSTSSWTQMNLYNLSDDGIYYPSVKITTSASYTGDMQIGNITDDEKIMKVNFSQISAVSNAKTVIVDCKESRITDASGKLIPCYKIGWDDMDNVYWLRLKEGKNVLKWNGTGKFELMLEFPRKVGVV